MKLNISYVLRGLIAALSIALLAQGIVGIINLRVVNASTVDLSTNWLPSVRELGELKYRSTRLRLVDARYVAAIEPPGELDTISDRRSKDVEAVAARYEPLIASAEERAIWDSFQQNWSAYQTLRLKMKTAAKSKDQTQLNDLFQLSRKPFEGALDALDRNTALNVTGGERAQNSAGETYVSALWLTGLLCVFATMIGLAGIVYVVLGVTRPIDGLIRRMRALAEGDTTAPVPYLNQTNEIGSIAAAVEASRDNLVRSRRLEDETVLARASAEEQRKAGMCQMADAFEQAVGGIVDRVSSSAAHLQATAQAMSARATETASQSFTVASAAEQAAANVQTVAAAAEELGSSVQEIGRQVSGSSEMAQAAVGEADQTMTLVQDLSQASARIGAMVGLISNIASQTNLLALNATIEAARAGETGRGFAVVATEVKELAAQTGRATEEIGSQIGQIQSVTGQAVAAIASISTRIREMSEVAASIAAAVEQQGAATQEIVRNVAQASTGTGEVTSNISGVAMASEETGTAAHQVLGSAAELSRQSERLSVEVGRFLGTVRAA